MTSVPSTPAPSAPAPAVLAATAAPAGVHATAAPTGAHATAAPARSHSTVRAMELGQHVIAAALTLVGAVRAHAAGVALPVAILCALALLAWHTAGTVFPVKPYSRKVATWWLLGFAFIWLAAVAVSPEFVWLAFLLWILAGHLLPLAWGLAFSVAVLVIAVCAPILHHGSASFAHTLGPVIGGVFAFAISRGYLQLLRDASERERLLASLTVAQQEMALLHDELARTQRESGAIAERTRISRDIHDTVAQALSSIRLIAHTAQSGTHDVAAGRALAQVEELSGRSLADVRRIVAALAPAELENGALAAALQRMLDRARDEASLETQLHVDESLPILPTEIEVALLRTAQSALSNVRLHSDAKRVVVSLIDAGDAVRLDIIDDGRGFDLPSWERKSATSSSYGLRFMRTRLRELGGGLEIETTPGEGTALSIFLPLAAEAPQAATESTDATDATVEETP
ncbi:sensor histidine kinase [Buchananella felis]|uniref:sensor histidine kinase n=1 Tax=Buchananella felis TaxID=3231492 RepID=UPI003527CAE4